ncbi:ABC transporter permease [candidate division KSB1 bacterium]|nr:ABC transporter permease [candidate division KSB1 bacterium]NIR72765.1 ABC transporter permease [candidate division KSB1 bacterium]NIS23721.1 ABC transporter permease [candidate division KSB1 bacterium]NIT70641.1 ABC transporter permease [candidate division KSB1 bacterium]NIU24369.1 ABC transporter permease [candidate division KSB1 bacterium]
MLKFVDLAWRNIWRNRRRTLITVAAVAFAILIVAITRSLQYGTYDMMESLAVRLYNGEIQVQREGFHEEQSLTYFLKEQEKDWQALIQKYPQLTAYTKRITGFGLVSSDSASTGALIVGIEPEKEREITEFADMVQRGRQLQLKDYGVVLLGQTLARNLQADVGDTVVVLTQGYRNQLGADSYMVKGTVSVGSAELDRAMMIMPLRNAQELFSLYDGITQVVFSSNNFRKADDYASKLTKDLGDERYEILSWEELMPELKQIILVDNISGAIYLAFILIVVGIEIFNTTMMSVLERTREFGILQAIGMKSQKIGGLILFESLLKLLIALGVGLIVSLIVVSILSQLNIPLPEEMREAYANYGFVLDSMKFSNGVRVYFEPIMAVALIALLALIFPLYKTSKLTPMEAFRRA